MMERLLQIITERRSLKFYKSIDVLSVTNVIDQDEVTMIFFAVKFFCGLVVNKLKGRKLFPYSMNRNDLEITLAWRDGNYCTMENLRHLICSK